MAEKKKIVHGTCHAETKSMAIGWRSKTSAPGLGRFSGHTAISVDSQKQKYYQKIASQSNRHLVTLKTITHYILQMPFWQKHIFSFTFCALSKQNFTYNYFGPTTVWLWLKINWLMIFAYLLHERFTLLVSTLFQLMNLIQHILDSQFFKPEHQLTSLL